MVEFSLVAILIILYFYDILVFLVVTAAHTNPLADLDRGALLNKRIYANEAEADLRSAWQLFTVREELTSRPQNDRGVADEFSVITFLALFGVQISWR